MLAVITRPMVIATDAGTSKQFMPLKDASGEPTPQTMSEGEFGRLRRAGAAQRFIEVNHAEVEAEPATGAIEPGSELPAMEGNRLPDAGAVEETGTQGEAETLVPAVTSELSVKPKARKAK